MTGQDLETVDGVLAVENAPAASPSGTLFGTDNPVQVLQRASEVASALKDVLRQQGLTAHIEGKEHVLVEGWTTLGSMLGVVPVTVWTRQTDDGWEARVEARTLDGRTVGAAEASCSRSERRWAKKDDYAIRSMAQTRGVSKALRGPLGFIVTLAGYQATPAEEMPVEATSVEEPVLPLLDAGLVDELAGIARQLVDAKAWTAAKLKQHLVAAGAKTTRSVPDALRSLSPEQADELKVEMVSLLAEVEVDIEAGGRS